VTGPACNSARLDALQVFAGDQVRESERINCHHSYTEREQHGGKEVWLSRKGAISAKAGELGLIPGSMGTRSYVVRGLCTDQSALPTPPSGRSQNVLIWPALRGCAVLIGAYALCRYRCNTHSAAILSALTLSVFVWDAPDWEARQR
jgi:tRNA-splicing ligase RtcB